MTFARSVSSTVCEFRSRQQKFLTLIFFSLDANGTLQKMAVFLCTHFINQKIINPGTLKVRAYSQLIKWLFSIPCRTGQLCISRAPILTCPQALCMLKCSHVPSPHAPIPTSSSSAWSRALKLPDQHAPMHSYIHVPFTPSIHAHKLTEQHAPIVS